MTNRPAFAEAARERRADAARTCAAARSRRARRRAVACAIALGLALLDAHAVGAAPVTMRYPEGPARGFLAVFEPGTHHELAQGELIQRLERRVVVSRLVIHFADGSLYDETVRFAQKPVFRVLSYALTEKGTAFPDETSVQFDRSGRYDAMLRARGEPAKHASGTTTIPEDVSNGLTSVLLKNLPPGASAHAHLLTFRPEPLLLDVDLAPEGSDPFWVGDDATPATRFLVKPTVPGVKGLLASMLGREPPEVRMWIAPPPAPGLVRFQGALSAGGPPFLIELSGPRWKK